MSGTINGTETVPITAGGLATPMRLIALRSVRLRTADGRVYHAQHADGARAAFALPPGAAQVTIESEADMPWMVSPWIDDRRRLGVAIDRVRVHGADETRDIALDGPALGRGWWAAERAGVRCFRWTDGAAELALPAVAGPAVLEIGLHAVAAGHAPGLCFHDHEDPSDEPA